MAFELNFTTIDYNQGKSIRILDACTDWADVGSIGVPAKVRFTVTSLYDDVTVTQPGGYKEVLVGTVAFAQGFIYELTNVNLGFSSTDTVKDSIYRIKMDVLDAGNAIIDTYTSDEVFYYNMIDIRDKFISEQASFIDDVHYQDMDYANWLDFLVSTIEANILYGNTSAIYYVFDIESRLSS